MSPDTFRKFTKQVSVGLLTQLLEQFLESVGELSKDEELNIVEYKGFPNKDNLQTIEFTARKRGGVEIIQYVP